MIPYPMVEFRRDVSISTVYLLQQAVRDETIAQKLQESIHEDVEKEAVAFQEQKCARGEGHINDTELANIIGKVLLRRSRREKLRDLAEELDQDEDH